LISGYSDGSTARVDRRELVDIAVVHEQPAAVAEGVAVGLLHGAADRRPDMGEEQGGADMAGELAQVLIVPGRLGAVEDARGVGSAVPADAEPVSVSGLGTEPRMQALSDKRIGPLVERLLDEDRRT
jgi:hypothetical protein